MAGIQRVVLLLLLCCICPSAFADFPPSTERGYKEWRWTANGTWFRSLPAACTAKINYENNANPFDKLGLQSADVEGDRCSVKYVTGANAAGASPFWIQMAEVRVLPDSKVCTPSNSTLKADTQMCQCNTDYKQAPGPLCVPLNLCETLNKKGSVLTAQGTSRTVCYSGTLVSGSTVINTLYAAGVAISSAVVGPFVCGDACGTNPAAPTAAPIEPPKTPSPSTCDGYWGSVNGEDKCVPKAAQPGSPGTKTTTPEGSAGNTKTTTTTNPDGSKTETKTATDTSCVNGTCNTTRTVTTVVIPVDGGPPTTTTTSGTSEESSQLTFCQENPQSKLCKEEEPSSYAGSCSTPPVCSGDAIQCAVARQTLAIQCALKPEEPPERYNAAVAALAEAGPRGGGVSMLPTTETAVGSLNKTEIYGTAGVQDLAITVAGQSVTLKLSDVNYWLELLGKILVAVTALACAKIIIDGCK